jgi:D-3-phosphoglycerate dehydrogenase / 2-oxoglutarate reductase
MPDRECLIVQPIHTAGIDRLREAGIVPRLAAACDEAAVVAVARDATAIITRSAPITAAIIAAAPSLKVIGVHGVGTNGIALDAATDAGIAVVNTPGTNTRSVAEHAIALTFALAKDLRRADQAVRDGDFDFKYRATLTELSDLTFGLIGFGATGQATARLAQALGMRTLAYGPTRAEEDFAASGTQRCDTMAALLALADVVSLHLPLTPATAGLIGAAELAQMKPSAFLINTGRGGILDETALLAALDAGRIAGAGLDVFSREPMLLGHPLLTHERIILSPHSAGSTEACLKRTALAVADAVIAVLSGQAPASLINADYAKRAAG